MKKAVIVLAVVLVVSGAAQAGFYGAMSAWRATPVQQVGDVIFTYVSDTLPDNVMVGLGIPVPGIAQANFSTVSLPAPGPWSRMVKYTVKFDESMSPLKYLKEVGTDSDVGFVGLIEVPNSITVTKTLLEPNPDVVVSSVNGLQDSKISWIPRFPYS